MMNISDNTQNSLNNSSGQLQNGFQNGNLKNSAQNSTGNSASLSTNMGYENASYVDENASLGSSFKEIINGAVPINTVDLADIESILKDMDLAESYNYESASISREDAAFFVNMLNANGITNYSMSNGGSIYDSVNMKSVEVSKTLNTLLSHAYESNKSIRLDFDNNVTVILKLTNEGKLNAHFIPGDKAVEEYLRNNIPFLKQRFEEQNLSYANISYKSHKENQGNNQNQQNDKENKNE